VVNESSGPLFLSKAALILRSRAEESASLITLEMGELIAESRVEVAESSPIGALLGIEPWNSPCYQLARLVAPNLMVGNVVMVKHAPSVPQRALAFIALFEETVAPEGASEGLTPGDPSDPSTTPRRSADSAVAPR